MFFCFFFRVLVCSFFVFFPRVLVCGCFSFLGFWFVVVFFPRVFLGVFLSNFGVF